MMLDQRIERALSEGDPDACDLVLRYQMRTRHVSRVVGEILDAMAEYLWNVLLRLVRASLWMSIAAEWIFCMYCQVIFGRRRRFPLPPQRMAALYEGVSDALGSWQRMWVDLGLPVEKVLSVR